MQSEPKPGPKKPKLEIIYNESKSQKQLMFDSHNGSLTPLMHHHRNT